MSSRGSLVLSLAVALPALLFDPSAAGRSPGPSRHDATRGVRPAELAGLYRMEVPDVARPGSRLRRPVTEVTFLRLLPDGRSRLENVTLADRAGSVTAAVEVGPIQRRLWDVRVPDAAGRPAPALARLCFEHAGALQCERYERDADTGDVSLYAGPNAASLTLRLERVRTR